MTEIPAMANYLKAERIINIMTLIVGKKNDVCE